MTLKEMDQVRSSREQEVTLESRVEAAMSEKFHERLEKFRKRIAEQRLCRKSDITQITLKSDFTLNPQGVRAHDRT